MEGGNLLISYLGQGRLGGGWAGMAGDVAGPLPHEYSAHSHLNTTLPTRNKENKVKHGSIAARLRVLYLRILPSRQQYRHSCHNNVAVASLMAVDSGYYAVAHSSSTPLSWGKDTP